MGRTKPSLDESDTPIKRGRRTRKDPRAPKRSKSAYIFFAIDRREMVKGELGPGARVGDIAKKTSQFWKALDDEERKKWEEVAKSDRERYQEEKAAYTGPLLIPGDMSTSRKAKKDPNAPKRPLTAFLYFSQRMRPSIKEQNPEWRIAELSQELGRRWREMDEEARKPYTSHEAEERKKYQVVNAKYKEEQGEKEKEKALELEEERKKQKELAKLNQKKQAKADKQRQQQLKEEEEAEEEAENEREQKRERQQQAGKMSRMQDPAFAGSMHDLYRQQAAASAGSDRAGEDGYMGMNQYGNASALAGMFQQEQGMMGYQGMMGSQSAALLAQQQAQAAQAQYGEQAGLYGGLGSAGGLGMGEGGDPYGGVAGMGGMGAYGAGMGGMGGMGAYGAGMGGMGGMSGMGMYGGYGGMMDPSGGSPYGGYMGGYQG